MTVREFLEQIGKSEIILGKKYSVRIDLNDGGFNSYIGFCVDTDTYNKKTPETIALRLFRHTNSIDKLANLWCFRLGDIIHGYPKNQDVLMRFDTYGKTWGEAEREASQYFEKIKKLIQKATADYKIQISADAEAEREQLRAKLKELEGLSEVR